MNIEDLPTAQPLRRKPRWDRIFQKAFDLEEGREAKEKGQDLAAEKRKHLLALARSIAREVALQYGECTADDVQRELIRRGLSPSALGNAAGSIFRGKEWYFTGRWKPSERISNHARVNRVWALKEVANEDPRDPS